MTEFLYICENSILKLCSMNDFNEKLDGIRRIVSACIPALLALMVVTSFCLSVFSVVKSNRTSKEVAQLARDVSVLVEEQQKGFKDMNLTLDAIEGHVAFLNKYLGDHATFFYGNERVTVKSKNNK